MGSPDPDVVEAAVDSEGDHAGVVDPVGADPVVDFTGPVRGRGGLRAGVVGGGRGGPVGQGPVGPALFAAFEDISAPLTEAAARIGVDALQLGDNGRALIEAIPSRWVEMKLRQQRQANPQKVWQGNDLNDVTALAIAVPYCGMVVTERSWSAMLTAAKVPERFGTKVTPRLQDVADRLT